ncbi:MAG: xanthine dehydrogenase family protein molybdopterin-binding subunit, partial [Paracoccaceae bacterium]
MNYVSTRMPILDGYEKVSGRLTFTEDLKIKGLLHAKLIFSPVSHAIIKSIDSKNALGVPGVVGIFHHGNTPDNNYNSTIWFEGQEAPNDEQMFPRIVRHIGDRVAAVVAQTQEIAEAAAGLIEVEYEALPAVFDALKAERNCAAQTALGGAAIFDRVVEETAFDYGDTDMAFRKADLIVETTLTTPRTHHGAIENHTCIAMPEDDGRILIMSPCQSIFAVQVVAARAMGVPASELRVIKTPIGGSFGGKAEPVLDPLCAHFAKALGRPVTISYDRSETFSATRTRSGAIGTIKTAADAQGRILAREADVLVDVGAYATGGIFLPKAMSQRLCRLYSVKNQRYRGRSFYTNTVPAGAYRGYGSPQIHAISEINIDQTAAQLKMDPVAFRLKNLVYPDALDPTTGVSLGNARIRDCIQQGARRFDWDKRRKPDADPGRFRRGTGMACATHINGCFPGFHEATTATLALTENGRIDLTCALHDLGAGSDTSIAQIIAEVLGISPERINFGNVDTDICAHDLGTRASRMTYIVGEAGRQTAELLKKQMLQAASLVLNCAPSELTLEDGWIMGALGHGRALSLAELAMDQARRGTRLEVTHTYRVSANPGSYAAHFSQVEVDILTGAVKVLDYLAVHDLGRAINPQLVEGQIHGGIQMGMGYALFEDIDIDPQDGQMKGNTFSRYHLV